MNKIDIFNANAEFFERFNNSLEDTAKDRHDRTRFTVTGLENKVEFAVTNAQGRIKKAEEDAVDRLNQVNGITNDELISKSVGVGKWMREDAHGWGGSTTVTISNPEGYTESRENKKTSTISTNAFIDLPSGKLPAWLSGVRVSRNTAGHGVKFLSDGDRMFVGRNDFTEVITTKNTRTDKNNVLHSGTGTPINTLNVSDMAQDVVDRDDITVTSGAVYRVIQELRAEIALLKGNTYE